MIGYFTQSKLITGELAAKTRPVDHIRAAATGILPWAANAAKIEGATADVRVFHHILDDRDLFGDGFEGEFDRSVAKSGRGGGKNDPPQAVDDAGSGFSGAADRAFETTSVLLNDTDPNGDQLNIVGIDLTGTLGLVTALADGRFTYDPAGQFDYLGEGETATDQFHYTVDDGRGGTSTASVTITVTGQSNPDPDPPPDPPVEPPYYILALMAGEEKRYNADAPLGTAVTVTFAFADATPDYYAGIDFAWRNFAAFSDVMKAATRDALQDISAYANITFVETTLDEAAMVFGTADIGARGLAYHPATDAIGATAGDVWLDDGTRTMSFAPGSEAYKTLIHEIGHALGLTHPSLSGEEQSRQYSVMSYYHHPSMDGEPITHMLYDIATIQYLYGANAGYAASDDVYVVTDFQGRTQTLWDAGGHDVIDLSDAAYGVIIDLREGGFSTIDAKGSNNLAIAFGTLIEDAAGGSFDDTLIGNAADNRLTGGDGADIFVFDLNSGADVIADFQPGIDRIDLAATQLGYEELQVLATDEGLVIALGSGEVLLEGVSAGSLSAADFLFG